MLTLCLLAQVVASLENSGEPYRYAGAFKITISVAAPTPAPTKVQAKQFIDYFDLVYGIPRKAYNAFNTNAI